jgi:C-terminal processing protease CtpA/Prc
MTKHALIALSLLVLTGCASVEKQNARLNDLIAADKLRSDVDYTHRKLEKLHPNLYWYISKQNLDHKFDSLKATITKPMTRLEFHKKLSPVVCAVREGHMFVYPPVKGYTGKQNDSIKKAGIGPLSQFDFEYIDGKLIVVKNKSYDKSIKPGAQIVAIDGKSPLEVINEYDQYYTSDGFNTTLKKNFSGTRFGTFYTYKNGLKNELKFDYKFNDSLKTVSIKRYADTTGTGKKKNQRLTDAEIAKHKADKKALRRKRYQNGYDEIARVYNRNLRFMESDSSVAVMKIRGFTKGNPDQFYEDSFKKIKEYKATTLVLDLRNNGGGRLSEIVELYSYLADSTFVFIDESEVTSKTSLVRNTPYFTGGGPAIKAAKFVFAPFFYGYTFFKVHKNDSGKYVYAMNSKPQKVKPDAFKGKIYVLINGGSFSASCILSSNLKGSKRAYFVGEETGGTYNGSVAGIMPSIKLPESGIKIRVGLVFIAPHYKTEKDGRGIFPDKEIVPTLQDRINQTDVEMEWVLQDIKAKLVTTAAN